jgi:hypothetical protein
MKNKGQITVFIILGLIIMFTIGLFLFVESNFLLDDLEYDQENTGSSFSQSTSVQLFFESCLEDQLAESIDEIALNGGYYESSDELLVDDFDLVYYDFLPYYYLDYSYNVISQNQIELELAKALTINIGPCLNFSSFPYVVESNLDDLEISTDISEGFVKANVKIPISVEAESLTSNMESFEVEVESSLYKLYNLAQEISLQQEEDVDQICLTCFANDSISKEVEWTGFDLENLDVYSLVYILTDAATDLQFMFAHKFELSETEDLYLEYIEDQVAFVGEEFNYQVEFSGEDLTFYDDTDLFDIDSSTGLINFELEEDKVGSWIVQVIASDEEENHSRSFTLKIVDGEALEIDVKAIPHFTLLVGEEFSHEINYTYEGEGNLSFYTSNQLVIVDSETGVLSFVAIEESVGNQDYSIMVSNEEDQFKIIEGIITVLE